jgi:hypothetical protein
VRAARAAKLQELADMIRTIQPHAPVKRLEVA